jgi:hypothetical protein
MFVAGAVCLFLAGWRGGTLRAVVGAVTLLAAPAMPGIMGAAGAGPWIGAVGSWLALGVVGVCAGSLLSRWKAPILARGRRDLSQVLHGCGWLALLGASIMQVAALGVAEPLMAGELPSSGALTLLAAEAAVAWLLCTAVRSRAERSAAEAVPRPIVLLLTASGLAGYAYSQFAAALAVRWIAPEADHVWYSFVMLGVAAAWSHSRTLAMRRLDMSSHVAAWMFGLSSVGSVLFATPPALLGHSAPGPGYYLLAAVAAALWGFEAWRFRERVFVAAASAASSLAIYLVAWAIGGRSAAGLAAACAALVLVPLPAVLRRGQAGSRIWWTAASLAAGLPAAASLAERPAAASVALLALGIAAAAAFLAERSARPAPLTTAWLADAGAACAALAAAFAIAALHDDAGTSTLGLAWIVAVAGSLVFEVWARVRARLAAEAGVVVLAPLVAWGLVALVDHAVAWTAVAALCSAAPMVGLAWWRGGHARMAAAGLVLTAELPLVVVHAFGAGTGHGGTDLALGTDLLLGFACLLASFGIRAAVGSGSRWLGAHDVRRVAAAGGWLLVSLTSAGSVVMAARVRYEVPRPLGPLVLCALALAVWLLASAARWRVESRRRPADSSAPVPLREIVPVVIAFALSLYLAGVIEYWVLPHRPPVWIAAAVLVAGLLWSHLRSLALRWFGCAMVVVELAWVLTSGALTLLVLARVLSDGARPGYAAGAVLLMAGLAWCAETARFGRRQFLPAAAFVLVVAAGMLGWSAGSEASGGLVAAVAGALLALAPVALRRPFVWRQWWSVAAALAAAAWLFGAFTQPWSATCALAAVAVAIAGPAMLGLPVLAGVSALTAFGALCSLESWASAGAWVGVAVTVVASAAMLAPTIVRRGRQQGVGGASWSLAVGGAAAMTAVLAATAAALFEDGLPAWLAGGEWSLAILLCALAAYCGGWSLAAGTRWGLAAGPVILLAGLLMVLRAAGVHILEAYSTVVALWCAVVAWRLSRTEQYRRASQGVDVLALITGLGAPAVLMFASGLGLDSTGHATWLICLSAGIVGAGVGLHVRLYFGCGLGGVVLAAFWLTSSHLSAIPSVVAIVAVVGGALITLGAVGERRRARLTLVAKNAFAGWR